VSERRDDGDIGAGLERKMIRRLDMGRTHQFGAAGVDHDELGAFAQPLLDLGANDGMSVGRVAADDQHDIGFLDRVEILRACGCAERLA